MKYAEVREMLLRHWTYTGGPNEAHSVEIYQRTTNHARGVLYRDSHPEAPRGYSNEPTNKGGNMLIR